MDPNLEKILTNNRYLIGKGSIKEAIEQATDYLGYILGHETDKYIEKELQPFIRKAKDMRRTARSKRKQRLRA